MNNTYFGMDSHNAGKLMCAHRNELRIYSLPISIDMFKFKGMTLESMNKVEKEREREPEQGF